MESSNGFDGRYGSDRPPRGSRDLPYLESDMSLSKHKAARILGHYGGLKGGKARARKLSAKRRSAIARKGGKARSR